MAKLFSILGIVAAILAVVLSFTPIETIAFLPAIVALLFGFMVLKIKQKRKHNTQFPKIILALGFLASTIIIAKELLFEDNIAIDEEFEQRDKDSEQDAQEDLKDIDELLEDEETLKDLDTF